VEAASLDMPAVVLGISTDSPDFETELDAEIERLLSLGEDQEPVQAQIPSFTAPEQGIPPEPLPGDIQETPGRASSFQKFLLWAAENANLPDPLPPAPYLRGSVEECTVRLTITDSAENELGYRLYRLGPLDTGWDLAADLQAGSGLGVFEYSDPERFPGVVVYYAASYNASGENPGNFLSLEVTSQSCRIHSPLAVSLQNALLTPSLPVDRLYCYASQDGSDWARIPWHAQEFVDPVEGVFDLSPHLRALGIPGTPLDLSLECWGWQGETLVPLGSGGGTIGAAEGPLEFDADGYHFEADAVFGPVEPWDRPLNILTIFPPVNLHYPDSLAGCDAFTGGDAAMEWACENLIDPLTGESTSGHNILVWHYYDFCKYDEQYCEGYLPFSSVQGYHVYRQTKNAMQQWNEPILIRTVDRNDVLMAVLSPGETTSASSRTRYFVRAFVNDGYESGDSNYVEPVPANFRSTIPAMFIQGMSVRIFKPGKMTGMDIEPGPQGSMKIVDSGIMGSDSYWVSYEPILEEQTEDGFLVGYWRSHAEHLPVSTSLIWDAWVQFDLSQVSGTITSALLRWDGDLLMAGSGWDKWGIWCGNQMTTFYGWPVDYYMKYLLPSDDIWGVDVTNLVLLQQQAEAINYPVEGMTPYAFGFYMWSGLRTHYTTEYRLDYCYEKIINVRLEVEYTK
jgi:hypothetical protein